MKLIFSKNDFYNLKYEPISRKSFLKHINFERNKTDFYIKVLYKEFNKLCNKNYSIEFWKAILDFFILYQVSICRGYYFTKNKIKKKIFIKNFRVLDKKSYYIPEDISDYRQFFQRSTLGDEQSFSLFINFFFKNNIKKIFSSKRILYLSSKSMVKEKENFFSFFLKKFLNKFLRILINPKALITGCYWKVSDRINICFYSVGKILFYNFFIPYNKKKKDIILRNKFFEEIIKQTSLSEFDRFFLKTLIFSMPISLFENLNYRINYTESFIKKKRNLRFIFNENLSEDNLLLVAISRLKSIKTIYLEHNSLQMQFLGNILNLIKSKFDRYFTLGWQSIEKKFIPAGSNFNWRFTSSLIKKKIDYLFISDFPELYPPYLRASYGSSGIFNSKQWYTSNITFFKHLSKKIKYKILFKEYPEVENYLIHDSYKKFINFISRQIKIKFVNKNNKIVTPKLISSSKLVIINYLSTPYIQSLAANIPTIIYCNYNYSYLETKHNNFYKDLVKVNILHKDSQSAALFLNYLVKHNEIKNWWMSNETQLAVNNFLKSNLDLSDNLNKLIFRTVNNC
jgi:putative transferase (TIGR04331 family)